MCDTGIIQKKKKVSNNKQRSLIRMLQRKETVCLQVRAHGMDGQQMFLCLWWFSNFKKEWGIFGERQCIDICIL